MNRVPNSILFFLTSSLLLLMLFVLSVIGFELKGNHVLSSPSKLLASIQNDISSRAENGSIFTTPLRLNNLGSETLLTGAGILAETNTERVQNGLSPLVWDDGLTAIAKRRLDDMFTDQYFEHTAPDGATASQEAAAVKYEYITIGENLALGNFGTDTGVVTAWMGSPGHRKNILSPSFTNLGVAAKKGVFEGEETWIAVQIFSTPASACPEPNPALNTQISGDTDAIASLVRSADNTYASLTSMKVTNQTEADQYNALVDTYNNTLAAIQSKESIRKQAVDQYNTAVAAYNDCLHTYQPTE